MNRFVLLDRDGTLNVECDYLSNPDQVELIPGVLEGLRLLRRAGLGLVVVTNQSGLARGYFSRETLLDIHERMCELLRAGGVHLDGIYFCPHHPDDGCICRKPSTGLIEEAAEELGFDPRESFVIGDKICDVDLGRNAGATTFMVRSGYGSTEEQKTEMAADYVVDDLYCAAQKIVSLVRPTAGRTTMEKNKDWAVKRAKDHLTGSIGVKELVLENCLDDIVAAALLMKQTFETGNKILLCGNGGSAADCQHLAAEFVSRLTQDFPRPALPAIALTTDTSFLTAFANDCGYEGVFARQVEALGCSGDLLLGVSTSGNSANVVAAVDMARKKGMKILTLCGEGGALAALSDVAVCVPSGKTQYIQESHLAIYHILCDLTERFLFAEADPDSAGLLDQAEEERMA